MDGTKEVRPKGTRTGGSSAKPRHVTVSKAMSKLLRHQLDASKITRYPGGYISVKDMLEYTTLKSQKVTFDEVRTIVVDNDKQRFSMIPKSTVESNTIPSDDAATATAIANVTEPASSKPQDYLIRANQGHSVAIASQDLLSPLTEANIPETVVHGTTHGAWLLIAATGGLKRMDRVHIHFASGLPAGLRPVRESSDDQTTATTAAAAPVISGMRNSSTVLVYLDVRKAMAAGIAFWTSENGVILSEGDENGVVGLEYFARVEDRTGGCGVLVQDGRIVKDAPESWRGKGMQGARGGKNKSKLGVPGSGKEADHDTAVAQNETT